MRFQPEDSISISSEVRHQLFSFYDKENQLLFEITGRSIPEWEHP